MADQVFHSRLSFLWQGPTFSVGPNPRNETGQSSTVGPDAANLRPLSEDALLTIALKVHGLGI
jgi:hypothetical protein